jgi:hypothetical protein
VVLVCAPRVSLTEIKLTCLSRVMTGIRDHTARLHAYKFTLYCVRRAKIMASAFITALPLSITLRGRLSGKNKNPPAKNVGTGRSHTHRKWVFNYATIYKMAFIDFRKREICMCFFYLNLHFARVCVCVYIQLSHECCFAAGHSCVLEIQISSHPVYTRVDSYKGFTP